MKLISAEISWLDARLDTYDIKYQEIYDEIRDHILSAVETARAGGDQRDIEVVYQEYISAQFPGYWPFEDIVKQYQQAYRHKINQAMRTNLKYYLNRQTIPLITLLLITGLYLPAGKPVAGSMIAILLLIVLITLLYTFRSSRKIRTDKGKHSLVKGYVLMQVNVLVCALNVLINGIAALSREWEPAAFLNPAHYPPVVFMVMISFFIVYGLSCMRLVKQEFKIAY